MTNPFRPTLSLRETAVHDRIVIIADGFLGRNEMVLPMTKEAFMEGFNRWESGEMIQRAFANLTPEQREFLLSGASLDNQDEMFQEDDE